MLPVTVRQLLNYEDENSNVVSFEGKSSCEQVRLVFKGSGNKLLVEADANITMIDIEFFGSNAEVFIGGGGKLGVRMMVGSSASVSLGRLMTTTSPVYMTALEGGSVKLGTDCMLAGGVQIRSDDAHAIFDVATGARINLAQPIEINDHVWLGEGSTILGGTTVGAGSVVGTRAVVKGIIPNNCVVAGNPGRVVRENVAWERPYLGSESMFDADGGIPDVKKRFWSLTSR